MFGLNKLFRVVTIFTAILIALSPALHLGGLANAATEPHKPGTPLQMTSLTPAWAQPQGDDGTLLLALNLVVRHSLAAAGWEIYSIDGQINEDSLRGSASGLTGGGNWRVGLLDEQGLSQTIEGSLNFSADSRTQNSRGFSVVSGLSALTDAAINIKGDLRGTGVEVALEVTGSMIRKGDILDQNAEISLRLLSGGIEDNIKMSSTGEVKLIGYNTGQSVVHGILERAGKRSELTEIKVTRSFGSGESEVWVETQARVDSDPKTEIAANRHLFQRLVGSRVAQYVDRFDLAVPSGNYTLQAPGVVTNTFGGNPVYNLKLVDSNGMTVELSGEPSSTRNTNGNGNGPAGLSSHTPATIEGKLQLAQPQPEPSESGPTQQQYNNAVVGAVVWGGLIVGGGAAIAGGAIAYVDRQVVGGAAEAAGNVLTAEEAAAAANTANNVAAGGGGVAVGGLVGGGIVKNADPYFVFPDVRSTDDAVDPSPVQITRAIGGLVPPGLTGTETFTTTSALETPEALQYSDNPVPFVGSTVPEGAKAVGEWTWDHDQMFGAMPSHTQARSDGPQMHYFIHAPNPFKVGPDHNIIQYVYLDPSDPPQEIFLQFYTGEGDGEHRAYWGRDRVQTGGTAGTSSLYPMRALPQASGWVRLQIPADKLGLSANPISGILYGAYGGKTWWGPTTTSDRLVDNAADGIVAEHPMGVPTTTHGSQIAFRLADAQRLSVQVVDGHEEIVRTLLDEVDTSPGYRVLVWDAKNDRGDNVEDVPYTVRFSIGGAVVAEHPVTISPLVANIETPGPFSMVRGNQVPVIGEAYGTYFSKYALEFGKGLHPASWQTIIASEAPTLRVRNSELRLFNPGNIANWDVGINEFTPWNKAGLNGVYTLRLTVTGQDGRLAVDSVPVVVGRLAHTAEGGTIISPDGKATLNIPPLATSDTFDMLAIVPAREMEPEGDWQSNLPADRTLAGEVYEVLRPDETFRRPATLELPYNTAEPADKVGVMLGDGRPDGWHYMGGKVDPERGVVSVPVIGFGGTRALLAPFTSDNFGEVPPDPTTNSRLSLDPSSQAPSITSDTAAFYSDLESSPGEWEALDLFGAQLARVTGPEAGLAPGNSALRVTRLAGGERLVRARSTPFDAAEYPILSFDYRLPPDYAPDLFVRSNGIWWQVPVGTANKVTSSYFNVLQQPQRLVADDAWHHYNLDLLALLRVAQPQARGFQVDEIVLGQMQRIAYMQVQVVDSGDVGSAYFIDNFAALSPTNATNLSFTWSPPSGSSLAGYAFALDDQRDTVPAEREQVTAPGASVDLLPNLNEGTLYFHLRGRSADGSWGATAHFPVLIDRLPPQIGRPDPPPGGAGSPDFILLPIVDAFGVDPSSLQLELNGQPYSTGRGITYSSELKILQVSPGLIEPSPGTSANGQKVELSLLAANDYAGNALTEPFSWSFTADRIRVSGSEFDQVTVSGGHSPDLSPDGTMLAFVSARSGKEGVWVVRTDDYAEMAGSAKALTGGDDSQADPAWSPGGKALAFVSETGGSAQIWTVGADGSGARAITAGDGGAASPTWLPDGTAIVFVREGNLWIVNADGGGLRALTVYPERPIRSVRSQPRSGGQVLAVGFKLYQETVQIYDLATGELRPITEGGKDREPAWLNSSTLLYTAPAGAGQPDAIWQVGLDGTGAMIMPESAEPGVEDAQPSASADGSVLAIVSTRGGERNIWVRQNSQVAWLEVSPSGGVLPGDLISINYALPTTVTTTLRIENKEGGGVRSLLDGVRQSRGAQSLTWDGKADDGAAAPPGEYLVKLTATTNDAEEFSRYATARIIDPIARGTLQLKVEQWAGEVARSNPNLHIAVYPQGTRAIPVERADGTSSASFELPAGRYDVLVEYDGDKHEERDLVVEASKTTTKVIDLQLGGLEVSLMVAPGQPVSAQAFIAVSRSGDPTEAALQTSYSGSETFVLPPGRYDVRAEYGGVRKEARGLLVTTAQVTRREINLDSGLVRVTVYSKDGELAESGGRLSVTAFDPRDRVRIATSYNNPAELLLPAGIYDLRIDYYLHIPGHEHPGLVGGQTIAWLNGVEIRAGQTVTREHNLRLTPVTIRVEEAPDKAPPAGVLSFRVYPMGERTEYVASALTNTAHLELREGMYEVVTTYAGIAARGEELVGPPFEVKYDQPVEHMVNMGLGHIILEVLDPAGQLAEMDGLYAVAYPSDQRERVFATVYNVNALDVPVRANTPYDIVIRQKDGRTHVIEGQQVKEGESLLVQVTTEDFKP